MEGKISRTFYGNKGKNMKQLAIISGKGGTGKTTITASLAFLTDATIADCDVDAPDLHILLKPEIMEKKEYSGLKMAFVDKKKCIECGKCREHCRFDAIDEDITINESCEGCGVCEYVCPVDAISLRQRKSGEVFLSMTKLGPMAHALLYTAEETSGKLVTMVRDEARQLAGKYGKDIIIIDGPPGIGCPVIAAMSGVDVVLIVTEPTISGIHDMERVLEVAKHFGIPAMLCINKHDINEEKTKEIEEYCSRKNIEVVGRIPFSKKFTEAMVHGVSIMEYDKKLAMLMEKMWEKVRGVLYE